MCISQSAFYVQHRRGCRYSRRLNRPRCGALCLENSGWSRPSALLPQFVASSLSQKLVQDSRGSPFSTRREFNNGPAAVLTPRHNGSPAGWRDEAEGTQPALSPPAAPRFVCSYCRCPNGATTRTAPPTGTRRNYICARRSLNALQLQTKGPAAPLAPAAAAAAAARHPPPPPTVPACTRTCCAAPAATTSWRPCGWQRWDCTQEEAPQPRSSRQSRQWGRRPAPWRQPGAASLAPQAAPARPGSTTAPPLVRTPRALCARNGPMPAADTVPLGQLPRCLPAPLLLASPACVQPRRRGATPTWMGRQRMRAPLASSSAPSACKSCGTRSACPPGRPTTAPASLAGSSRATPPAPPPARRCRRPWRWCRMWRCAVPSRSGRRSTRPGCW